MSNLFKTVAIVAKPDGQGVAAPLNILIDLLQHRGIMVRLDARTAEFATIHAINTISTRPGSHGRVV